MKIVARGKFSAAIKTLLAHQTLLLATEKAWQVPYEGTYHKLLFKNINDMKGSETYQNICAIVQSSGTGKSRMVHEQANLVFTLPINIRTTEGICAS